MKSGIYAIVHVATNRHYVGSSRNVSARTTTHLRMLRAGTHHSPHLQRAWDKYGADAFAFVLIETVECVDDLLQMEQVWIDRLHAAEPTRGFNTAAVAGTRFGVPQSDEARRKMSEGNKGRPKSAEHRAKIGAANRGKVRSDEVKARIAATVSSQMTDERRAMQSEYGKRAPSQKGKTMSPESRAKMSQSKKQMAATPEGKAALLANLNGTKH